jgi:hypothetical protein
VHTLLRHLRSLTGRFVPAVLTALGVVIVTAGLLSYADPATAGVLPSPSPSAADVTPAPSIEVSVPTVAPSGPAASAMPSGPAASAAPSPSGFGQPAVATRVVVPALRIDLPVVEGPPDYPYCNVAMYFVDAQGKLGQPGEGKPIYLFAHARDGMFGPIYNEVMVQHTPNRMVGMIVQVYTSDNKLYLYEVTNVYPHQLSLARPLSATTEQLWLQTSEGPHGTPGKTQVLAMPLSVGDADPKDAHPTPHPLVCS